MISAFAAVATALNGVRKQQLGGSFSRPEDGCSTRRSEGPHWRRPPRSISTLDCCPLVTPIAHCPFAPPYTQVHTKYKLHCHFHPLYVKICTLAWPLCLGMFNISERKTPNAKLIKADTKPWTNNIYCPSPLFWTDFQG